MTDYFGFLDDFVLEDFFAPADDDDSDYDIFANEQDASSD